MRCVIFEVVRVQKHCAGKPMLVLILRLPNPQSTTPRVDDYMMPKAKEVGQDHKWLLFIGGGISLTFRQQKMLCL
jgi:hypothetical protein